MKYPGPFLICAGCEPCILKKQQPIPEIRTDLVCVVCIGAKRHKPSSAAPVAFKDASKAFKDISLKRSPEVQFKRYVV